MHICRLMYVCDLTSLFPSFCSKILDRVVSVEYALRDDGERGDRQDSPRRSYGRRADSPYRRSVSPVGRRGRASPDYGRRPSPDYGRRASPDYGRRVSPDYGRRVSPDYGRPRSPVYEKFSGPSYDRHRSPEFEKYRR